MVEATRKLDFRELVLFQTMLTSLTGSLDCGFRYVVVIGYDAGRSHSHTVLPTQHRTWFQGGMEVFGWFLTA